MREIAAVLLALLGVVVLCVFIAVVYAVLFRSSTRE